MRPTLHDYNLQKLSDLDCTAISDVLNFTKLTNRAPRLGDFVPCDEEGNVLNVPEKWNDYQHDILSSDGIDLLKCKQYQAAQDRVIFAGDWEVANHIGKDPLITNGKHYFVWKNGICNHFNKGCLGIYRIENLPREIEFKQGVV